MTVWECMQMLGRHKKVRINYGERELTSEPFSAYDYEQDDEEFPRDVFEAILEKTAKSVDLEEMIIYCKE